MDRNELTERELATVLAALRLWQKGCADADLQSIASDEGAFPALDNAEVDDLCERLNCGIMSATGTPLRGNAVDHSR